MWSPDGLYFGPAGIPTSAKKRSTKDGVIEVKALGLDAMEIEFVRRVSLDRKAAREVAKVASQLGVVLTVHAPYYVNLAAKDEEKTKASIERIYRSATIGAAAGAWSVCFHPGFYLGRDPGEVYEQVKAGLRRVLEMLSDEGVEIWIRPETTGKLTQFGSLEETIRLSEELEMVLPVVDFAHIHARTNGAYNTYEEFREMLTLIESKLGREALDNMHIHVSGIDYGEKGEIQHLNLDESDFNYRDLLRVLAEFKVKGVVICESPNLEEDALLLKRTYEEISGRKAARRRRRKRRRRS